MKFEVAERLIKKNQILFREGKDYLKITQCLSICGISSSGYYSWKERILDKNGKRKKEAEESRKIKALFKKIIHKRGYVPGKNTFHDELYRMFNVRVSKKRCAKIMKEMNLTANRPKKDAYKHQACHDHICSSPANKVNQNFYICPRKIILSDITYFYYGENRTPFYTCVFKDAYTKEILGHASSDSMNVELIKKAYGRMMKNHMNEFKQPDVYIHSDQGSQYMSTTFKKMLEDEGFIQSVSARGNSQDNAPMESFFGRMKTAIIDLVALCPDLDTAKEMIDGYIFKYNNEFFQYHLAGLTPVEFYKYKTTGIYPCPEYFGIEAERLNTTEKLVEKRIQYAKRRQERIKRHIHEQTGKNNELKTSPIGRVMKDQSLVKKHIRNWEEKIRISKMQINKLNSILAGISTAQSFLLSLKKTCADEYQKLMTPIIWQNYDELSYIYDMKEMF